MTAFERLRRICARFGFSKTLLMYLVPILGLSSLTLQAQVSPVIKPGFKAITSFSGSHIPGVEKGMPAGVDPLDETLLDVSKPTLRIFDVTNLADKAKGQLVYTPQPFEVTAGQIGHVFGLAYDDGKGVGGGPGDVPNLYATATSLFGVQIVEADKDADGRPERLRTGKPGAQFMQGQFGPNNAGPGAIWKIDGNTGNATLFAQIPGNTGGALGNIAFDKKGRQFFVSDVDTGLIHRLSIDGRVLDAYDHGVTGLKAHGLVPVPDDGRIMDINSPAFNIEDPNSWGYTQDIRQVWGLAVYRDRLYYAVGTRAQIWSVGLGVDGSIINDARLEVSVTAKADFRVTDITFDQKGNMYLAQRGPTENKYNYQQITQSGLAEVLRYVPETPDNPATPGKWQQVPQAYTTGFSGEYRQAAGGIDLQYGYDKQGVIDYGKCTQTLFKTGDNLLKNPSIIQLVNGTDPNIVHGTQLTDITLVRPANEPPFGSWFFDQDGFFDDPSVRGHVGDVEVWRPCNDTKSETIRGPGIRYIHERIPGGGVEVIKERCLKVQEVNFSCSPTGNLVADFYMGAPAVPGANTLQTRVKTPGIQRWPLRQTRAGPLQPFSVKLRNVFPGDPIKFSFCIYDGNAAKVPGVSFPCCKADIQVPAPDFTCR